MGRVNRLLHALLASVAVATLAASAAQPQTVDGDGPQRDIECPPRAVRIPPGINNIQPMVERNPPGTAFCLDAGVFWVRSSIRPKSGNVFVGRYGAILDGTGWVTSDPTAAAFRAHNEDIDDVTIRNLVIRSMPEDGIRAFHWMSDRWLIEHNELAYNRYGLEVPNNSIVSHNYIHHNVGDPKAEEPARRGGGYTGYRPSSTLFEHNEIAFNGPEQKIVESQGMVFRRNHVHHNQDGIWFDGDNTGALIEGNLVEDNSREGIFYEISGSGTIRNNIVRRSGNSGIFVSTSKDTEVSGNVVEDSSRGIALFFTCAAIGGGALNWDLARVAVHDNVVKVGSATASLATSISHASACTRAQIIPYSEGRKDLTFRNNRYFVPTLAGRYWSWLDRRSTWAQWLALPQDVTGTINLAAEYLPPVPPQ